LRFLIEIKEHGLISLIKKLIKALRKTRKITKEEVEQLAQEVISAMQDSLPKGNMSKEFSMKWESKNRLVVSNTAPYKDHFIWGTRGPYKGIPFGPIMAWARGKGLDERTGRAIAVSISKIGTMNWSSKYKPKIYPRYGEGTGFDFPKYALEVLMKDKIDEVSNKITVRLMRESGL